MTYTNSLDKFARVTTILITIVFPFIIFCQFFILPSAGAPITALIVALLSGGYLLALGLRPTSYTLATNLLTIHRPLKNAVFNKKDITKVSLLAPKSMGPTIRIFGVGGLFGYFGSFATTGYGRVTMYATRRDNLVLIEMRNGKKIVISPDDPKSFVASFYL